MSLSDIEQALGLTMRMLTHAQAGEWGEVLELESVRSTTLLRLQHLRGLIAEDDLVLAPLLRVLRDRNEELRLLCEQARTELRATIQTASRGRAAARAYAGA